MAEAADARERSLWPWVLLALLLVGSIGLFFAYVPRGSGMAPPSIAMRGR
jgi:hypothetical protein